MFSVRYTAPTFGWPGMIIAAVRPALRARCPRWWPRCRRRSRPVLAEMQHRSVVGLGVEVDRDLCDPPLEVGAELGRSAFTRWSFHSTVLAWGSGWSRSSPAHGRPRRA